MLRLSRCPSLTLLAVLATSSNDVQACENDDCMLVHLYVLYVCRYHRVAQKRLTVAVNYWHDMAFDHKYVYHNFLMGLAAQPSFIAAAAAAAATTPAATTAAAAAAEAASETSTSAGVAVETVAQQNESTATDGTGFQPVHTEQHSAHD
jgi:hypothetical protein